MLAFLTPHHKRTPRRGPRLSLAVFCCGMASLLWCVGCLQPRDFTKKYLQLTISSLSTETGHLEVKVVGCKDGTKQSDPLAQERAVSLRFGSELFYVPPSLQGAVDIKVYGFRTSSKQTIVQYARQMVTLTPGQRAFPVLSLREGRPEQEPFWCERPTVKPPDNRKPPVSYADNVSMQPLPPGSLVPSLGPTPPEIPVPPIQPPKEVGDIDVAVLRSPLPWKRTTINAAASGRLIALVNQAEGQKPASISVIDILSGYVYHDIQLPAQCSPSGMDIQGNLIAMLCRGLGRLFYFTLDNGAFYGPKEGVIVGKNPIAVRMSGHVVVVANQDSQEVLVMRIGQWNVLPKTETVGESPSAIAAFNGRFFVTNALSNSVHSFIVSDDLEPLGDPTPYQTGKTPVGIAANEDYYVTANAGSANITIMDRTTEKSRSLYLGGQPHGVALLHHTAMITDVANNRLHLVDLRAGRVTQSLPMGQAIGQIVLAGEWLLFTSPKGGALARASLPTRSNLVHFRIGARPRYAHVAKGKAWVYDPLAKSLNEVDLRRHQIDAQHPLESDGWIIGTDELLLHTTGEQTKLVIRSLAQLSTQYKTIRYDGPIHHGRVVTTRDKSGERITSQSVYLLHQSSGKQHSVSMIHDLHLPQEKWRFEGPYPLAFSNAARDTITLYEPVDVLPWKNGQLLVIDQGEQTLNLIDPKRGKLLFALDNLPSRPRQMAFVGDELALLLYDGSLWMISVPQLNVLRTVRLANQIKQVDQIRDFHGLIVYNDKAKGQVVFLDPKSTQAIARFRVGCSPADIGFWRNPADTTSWRHLLVVTNECGESLSLYPLDLGTYTQ